MNINNRSKQFIPKTIYKIMDINTTQILFIGQLDLCIKYIRDNPNKKITIK